MSSVNSVVENCWSEERQLKEIQGLALFLPEIKQYLADKDYAGVKEVLEELHPIDLAGGWGSFTPLEKVLVFRLLILRRAIAVFENLPFEEQNYLLNNLESSEVAHVLDDMAADDRADLFDNLSDKSIKKLFSVMKEEEVKDVRKLLTYGEDTAGGLMTTEFIELKKNMTARQAILKIQQAQIQRTVESITTVYVTDDVHHLIGAIYLKTLIGTPPDMLIGDVMSPVQVIKINVQTDQEEVARIFSKYDLLSAPVVDAENVLLGIITIDDIVDVIDKEVTQDIYGMGKISGVREAAEIKYMEASVLTLVRNRVIWLIVLLIIGTFVSGKLLKGYSKMLESVIILAFFIPMLMDSGGNAGAQALAMIVRGLATGEVTIKQALKIALKEIRVGLIVGTLIGIVGFISAFLLQGFNFALGITVGISLMVVIAIATVTGSMLPLFFKYIGFDPAVAASPFITTIVDAACLIVYFELAKCILLK